MPKEIFKLKLADPPVDQLEQLAATCRKGVNSAVEDWLLRLRKARRRSKKQMGMQGDGVTPSTELYHAITAAVPELGTAIAASLSSQLWANLNAKIDWRERVGNGETTVRRRRDAIESYDMRPPFTTADEVPIPNKHVSIQFESDLTVTVANVTRRAGEQQNLVMRISCKGLPAGRKRAIRNIIAGRRKLSDSFVTQKQNKQGGSSWFLFMVLEADAKPSLNVDVAIELWPTIDNQNGRPFFLDLPNGKKWFIGDGRYLLAQTQRLIGLRKMIGYRYRQGGGAGHGRAKVDRAVKLRNQQLRNVRDEVRRRLINDILKQCERHDAGVLHYSEPTNPAKKLCWFEKNSLEFDWTRFIGDLINAAAKRGVDVQLRKVKYAEITKAA